MQCVYLFYHHFLQEFFQWFWDKYCYQIKTGRWLISVDRYRPQQKSKQLQFTNLTAEPEYHTHKKNHTETYLSQKPVHKHRFVLPKAVNPENTLDIIRWVPRSVKDDYSISSHKINSKGACFSGDNKQAASGTEKSCNLIYFQNSKKKHAFLYIETMSTERLAWLVYY